MLGTQGGEIDAELGEFAGAEVFDDNVSLCAQVERLGEPFGRFQVDGHDQLVAHQGRVGGIVPHRPRRRVDVDHRRAQIAQQHRDGGASDILAKVHDLDAGQR